VSKHTPGPWRFLEADDHNRDDNSCRPITICGPADDDLANVYSSDDSTVSISREETVANARLIAAAPNLLEAAKDALSGWRYIRSQHGDLSGVGWDRVEDALRAAIRAAEGK